MDYFTKLPESALAGHKAYVQHSIEQFKNHGIDVRIEAGTIVCVYVGTDGALLAHWLDDGWNFKLPAEQIIADLDEELPHLIVCMGVSGDMTIVLGELANASGDLTQAYGCTCNAEQVIEAARV